MGGPAAWLGVGNRPLFPCCWAFPVGRVSDARSSLICAGWLPQDGLFEWNGHHCLQKANVASSGLAVHRSRVDPVPRAGPGFNLPARTLLMILFVGRLLQIIVGGMLRRGGAGRSMTCPMVGLPAAVEAAGSRAAVGRRGSDRVSDP